MSDSAAMHRELFWMLCQERLGGGVSRVCWSSALLPDCVIKVEENSQCFQNIIEWETWSRVRGTPFEKWFAPCRWISSNGSVLIMAKTSKPAKYPDKVPAFMTDLKTDNWGIYKGKFVCHDYGYHLLMERGMTKRMRKADWK